MIAIWVALALAAPVDVERARLALELGRPDDAVLHARVAVRENPEDWRSQRIYAAALSAAGLEDRVDAELAGASDAMPAVAVVYAWHRAWRDEGRASALAQLAAVSDGASDVAAVAMARLAIGAGNSSVAREMAAGVDLPEAVGATLEAALMDGDDRAALAISGELLQTWPDRPDQLAPLFMRMGTVSGALRRARSRAIRAAVALGTESEDVASVYRARTLLVAAGASDEAVLVVARLTAMGEGPVSPRGPYSSAMRRTLVRGLSMNRDPVLPSGPWPEVRDIGIGVAIALADMGRIPEALAVWQALRDRQDDTELAVAHARQLLRAGRTAQAVPITAIAIALASAPTPEDVDRSGVRAWSHELAMAYAVAAEARLADERPDEALAYAVAASVFAPSAEVLTLRAAAQAALGQDEAAWTSTAIADALGDRAPGRLEATYPGVGFWADAARAAAQTWSEQTGAELPYRDAADLPLRPDRPVTGAPFPAWSAGEGDEATGSEALIGRVYVLAFWASWCAPCQRELPDLDDLAAQWADAGVDAVVVAVSTDSDRRAMSRFLVRHELENTVVRWAPEVGERLGITALPTTWVVDGEGIARHFHQGYGPGARDRFDSEVRALTRTP